MYRRVSRRERREEVVPEEPGVDEEREVVEEEHGWWDPLGDLANMLISLLAILTILAETALGFRLGFKLANANEGNNFVSFIYDVTDWMIKPFTGIFDNRAVDAGVFEPATVIAMVVFLVASILVAAVIRMIVAASEPTGGRPVTVNR